MTGILNNLDLNLTECQGLVLAPTRELAQQIEKVMRALGDYQQVRMGWQVLVQHGYVLSVAAAVHSHGRSACSWDGDGAGRCCA